MSHSVLCHCRTEHRSKTGSFQSLHQAEIPGTSSLRARVPWCPPAGRTLRTSTSAGIHLDSWFDRHRLPERGPIEGIGRIKQGQCRFAFFETSGKRLRQALGCRSEEHTSELQSLMRISYAVFCLKKKTHNQPTSSPPRPH